jgi:hypothetical protein
MSKAKSPVAFGNKKRHDDSFITAGLVAAVMIVFLVSGYLEDRKGPIPPSRNRSEL